MLAMVPFDAPPCADSTTLPLSQYYGYALTYGQLALFDGSVEEPDLLYLPYLIILLNNNIGDSK